MGCGIEAEILFCHLLLIICDDFEKAKKMAADSPD
jgi:hypothetical protein